MKYIYNKLVRDRIPENINSMEGRKCNFKILNNDEYLKELDKKLFDWCWARRIWWKRRKWNEKRVEEEYLKYVGLCYKKRY